jgi:hypothetical protein
MKHYQYEFVRLQGKQRQEYQELIRQYAAEGWRLVQIFAPGAGGLWASPDYIELIFEQKIESFVPESEGDAKRGVD